MRVVIWIAALELLTAPLGGCAPALQEPPYEVTEASTYWPIPLVEAGAKVSRDAPAWEDRVQTHYDLTDRELRQRDYPQGCLPLQPCGLRQSCPELQHCLAGCCIEAP